MKKNISYLILCGLLIMLIKLGIQGYRMKNSRIMKSIEREKDAEMGKFPEPPPELLKKMKEADEGIETDETQNK